MSRIRLNCSEFCHDSLQLFSIFSMRNTATGSNVAKGSTRQKSSAGVDKYRRLGTFDRRKSFCRPRIAFRVNILGVNASFVVNQSCFYFFEAV
jgi:hypothetical protein